ncbi:MAG: T9SS type A sorting domain-containing protein [Bacteroidota bacterium]
MKGIQLLRINLVFAMLITVTLSTTHAQQQWEPVNGPYTANIFAMGLDGNNNVLAGTEHGGVFRSPDAGANWVYSGLANETIRTLYRHSDGRIYAGLQNGMMFSDDNGATWEWSNYSTNNNAFGIGITSTGTQYVGGWSGLERSTDQGATFEKVDLTGFGSRVDEICIGSNDEILVGFYGGGLLRSADNGQTWTMADPLFANSTIDAVVSKGAMLFAGVQGLNIFRSSDGGATWSPSSGSLANLSPAALYARSETEIWVGDQGGKILYSADGGVTWTTQFTVPDGRPVFGIVEAGGKLFAGTAFGGVYISSDDGATWTQAQNGLSNIIPATTSAFVLDSKDNLYLSYRGGITVKSSDGGSSWTAIGTKDDYVDCMAIGPGDVLYAASRYLSVRHTSDNGATWVMDSIGLPNFSPMTLAFNPQGDMAVGGADGNIHVLEAGNSSWRDAGDALITSTVACLLWENGALFAGTSQNGLLRSMDKGLTWVKLNNGMNESYVSAISSDGKGGIYIGAYSSPYVSTDNGDSWTNIGDGSFNSVSGIFASPGGTIYASSFYSGVYVNGIPVRAWTAINSGLQNSHVMTLLLDGNGTIFAATDGNGVFRMTAPIVSVKNPAAAANGVELHAAYPNPFTSSTQFSYILPAAAHVRIAVYDMTGREVAVLVEGLRAAGTANAGFDASGLAPGMYLCKMNTGAQILTQPLMLLK